jgi:8-oxo-dGTP diphosphatase
MEEFRRLQFGSPDPEREHRDRPTAFGIAMKDGKLACVRIEKDGRRDFDLPGGALDAGETPSQAMVREFGEETGLKVSPGQLYACAAQFWIKPDGEAVNNLASFFTAEIESEDPSLKIEDDHTLVWLAADEAVRVLRHDYHAWAVAAWLRRLQPWAAAILTEN